VSGFFIGLHATERVLPVYQKFRQPIAIQRHLLCAFLYSFVMMDDGGDIRAMQVFRQYEGIGIIGQLI